MTTASDSIEIEVDVERVYDYLDDPYNHAEVTPSLSDVREVEPLENGGKRLAFTYEMAGVGVDGELVQTVAERNERMTFDMHGPLDGEIDLEFESTEDGTRLTYTGRYDVPGAVLSKVAEPFVRRYNERELRTMLENVKARLELEG
ncbi:Polyketide cyclase / dehydrase and lipid transport [Halobiforma haloterrestris]|uniref:Polyketide cyclase / dehydrase and lipid transport n=1 Tax=Natronobacterium haloterrestre TaxID=148448 RepID=A0A1I1HWH6_NATHA|nr:SRPBCC family protein [Halobiforma haloterrestris]SFC28201.1 Polyketide cyclase / dehydrase and lipid transport [Halobiforma haloterrestris]